MDNSNLSKLSLDGLCDALQDKIHESALLTLRAGETFVKLTEDELFPQVGARRSVAMVLCKRCSTVAKVSGVHSEQAQGKRYKY